MMMQAIQRQCLEKQYIIALSKEMAPVDPEQLERCMMAFELLGRLADAKIPFVFKGGTAVLLRVADIKRLSVDVDIASTWDRKRFEGKLDDVARRPPFLWWEERERRSPRLPRKRHYYCYYRSVVSGEENHVIVDVLEEDGEALYPVIEPVPLQMPFFQSDHPISIPTPTAEGLLGDKLTVFAPTTVGLPYDADSPIDLIKQLFDIGHLFDVAQDFPSIAESYHRVFAAENRYRGNAFTEARALDDLYGTTLTLSGYDLTKNIDLGNANLLMKGIRNLSPLLVRGDFTLAHAKVAAGKAALLSRMILNDRSDVHLHDIRFHSEIVNTLADQTIDRPLEFLNKLKGTNPEAFHYWKRVQII